MAKEYWITNSRFKWISLLMFLMFLALMLLLFLRANELRNNPCELCAAKQGADVTCSLTNGGKIFSKIYYQNFTTSRIIEGIPGG